MKMKHLISINESKSKPKIYAVIFERTNTSDFFRSKYIDDIFYFSDELNAADYIIRNVNKYHDPVKKFEPMKEDDGTRLFLKIKDNPDYKKAINFMKNYKDTDVYIKEVNLEDDVYRSNL